MRRLLTGTEMEELERWAVRRQGVTIETLMERAGQAVADRAAELAPNGPIAIVAGKGNNGGDGRVAARLLEERGIPVRLVDVEGAAAGDLDAALAVAALVVDAVFGSSLHGPPRAPADQAIQAIGAARAAGARVLAVDMPSGVEAHSGHAHAAAVAADETLTFSAMKLGQALEPGRSHAGQVRVVDIGIDPDRIARAGEAFSLEPGDIRGLMPLRPVDCHKKQCGRVLVVAGSQGMSGAACLTAEAALRSGAGTVFLAVPESLVGVVETKLTETVTVPLPETFSRSIDHRAVETVLEILPDFDVLAVGPGLSIDDGTVSFVRDLVAAARLPLVLDADGLNALIGDMDPVAKRRDTTVITPHPGELARLSGSATEEVQHDRPGFARQAALEWKCVTVLKGAATLTSDGSRLAVNPTGNPGMATMGAGDVLTGLIAGLMSQKLEPFDAAAVGAWLHGAAGDTAAEELTQYCVVAGDIIRYLPRVLAMIVHDEGGSDGADRA
jgi:NAD(P)H-hydrate epimerase